MKFLKVIALLSGFLLIAVIARAEPRKASLPTYAVEVWNSVKGPAAADVFRYAKIQKIVCFIGGTESMCSLASRTNEVSLFYIFTDGGPLPEYAFAVIYFSIDTGNALMFDAAIFQRAGKQGYAFWRNVDGLLGVTSGVQIDGKNFLVTTATMTENDSRCCPSGRTLWRVDGATGKASYESGNKVGGIP